MKSIAEAEALVKECKTVLEGNEVCIRNLNPSLSQKALNGPQGNVGAKTVETVHLLHWGLKTLRENTEVFHYTNTNLLSCMTLDIEHLHSTVNFKSGLLTMLQYAREFGNTVKESVKRTTNWAAFYHTSRDSWYPVPENSLHFSDVPSLEPLHQLLCPLSTVHL